MPKENLHKTQIMQMLQRQKAHAMDLLRDSPRLIKDYAEWRLTTLRALKQLGETNEFAQAFQQSVGEIRVDAPSEYELDG